MASAVRADRTAARWRGGLVGACSATVAAAAHGVGGGMVPAGATLALVVLGCSVVGVAAGGRLGRSLGAVAAFLVLGQAVGHLVLAFASGHGHGMPLTPAMLAAHLGAAALCGLLICAAERSWSALASYVWRLVCALTATASAELTRSLPGRDADCTVPGVRLGCTAGTRGPPLLFV